MHTSRVACHTCRDLDYCSKQGRGTSQHAFIATYHRSVKQWKVFIDLESSFFRFNSAANSLWIRVSPGSSSDIAGQNDIHADQNDIHVEMALILTHLSANQISVFSITQHSR